MRNLMYINKYRQTSDSLVAGHFFTRLWMGTILSRYCRNLFDKCQLLFTIILFLAVMPGAARLQH